MGAEDLHDISMCIWVQKRSTISACGYGFRRVALYQPVGMDSEELYDFSLCIWVQKSCMISACVYGSKRDA